MKDYNAFLASKRLTSESVGFDVDLTALNPQLFPFQQAVVQWALRRGRAALFEDCGLGKTPQQLEWARHVALRTGGNVLILAPLAVARQTAREGEKFGVSVTVCRTAANVRPGLNVTNYDMLGHFRPEAFAGIVLDESSILKSFGGSLRKEITEFGRQIPYRLSATATPAPNDLTELTNQAEFLEILTGKEIIALFFTQDGNSTHHWRLKGHAREDFWRWMASWSVAMRRPSDLGYSDDGFILPALRTHQVVVGAPAAIETLFPMEAITLQERQAARRDSIEERVAAAAELVNASTDQWVVWCNLNNESHALAAAIPDAIEVEGADDREWKERAVLDFVEGRARVLVSKPSICGLGLNLQMCHNVAYVGLSDSYEQLYQSTRRCWRFGQTQPVDVHVITSETEGAVVSNIERKERQAADMMDNVVRHMRGLSLGQAARGEMDYRTETSCGQDWTMMLGDSVDMLDELADNSVGLTVFSPPFPGMYAYTNSAHDIGNTKNIDEMVAHFRYLVSADKLLRVVKPGRMCAIHLCQLTAMKSREGYIGLHDYRGRVIQMMIDEGWTYAGEVTIDKNPQIQATRNKERGLLFKTLATDSSLMRMALADYLIYFRKPGENVEPIRAGTNRKYNGSGGWITEAEWIEWAAPVWYRQTKSYPGGIRETDVLNVRQARDTNDERHLCPLQLGVCERAIKLWSAPGDLVLDPFSGIASVGVKALEYERRFVGIELKPSYYRSSIENLRAAEQSQKGGDLFAHAGVELAEAGI